jgi:hypothetical protein
VERGRVILASEDGAPLNSCASLKGMTTGRTLLRFARRVHHAAVVGLPPEAAAPAPDLAVPVGDGVLIDDQACVYPVRVGFGLAP